MAGALAYEILTGKHPFEGIVTSTPLRKSRLELNTLCYFTNEPNPLCQFPLRIIAVMLDSVLPIPEQREGGREAKYNSSVFLN